MSALEQLASGALGWLWQTSVAAAVLAAIVLLLQLILGRWVGPRWTYVLWLLVVGRLALPFAPESSLSISNLYVASPEPIESVVAVARGPAGLSPRVQGTSATRQRVSLAMLVVAAWLLGTAGYLVACLIQYRRFDSWAGRQIPFHDSRIVAALRSAQRLLGFEGRLPVVVETRSIAVPAVLGILRPWLLLPKSFFDTATDDELELAMLHELIHVRRRDNLLNWALIFVQALHWFNPLVWLALRRFRAEREVLCDAIVLSRLQPDQRQQYGATLIKAAAAMSPLRLSPSLVPIVNHKHEIQRRIHMIARFKPTPRAVSVLATGFVLGLACVTFTGAAQKQKSKAGMPAATPPDMVLQRSLKTLEAELDNIEVQIRNREARVEHYRQELRIPSHIANGDGGQAGPDTELLRKLEGLRIDSEAELQRIALLYDHLAGLSRPDLRKVIHTAAPDQLLVALLERLAQAEQQLASLSHSFSADHPEVKSLTRIIERVNRQIDDRMDGILAGLKAKKASAETQARQLRVQIEEYTKRDIEAPGRYRDYFNLKRELQGLYLVRDRLQLRIIDEKIDAALPRRAKDINDSAPTIP